jgi:predicted ArsR family transcriptional regulator
VQAESEAPERARDRVLLQLKTRGPQTAAQIARRLGVTPMAVRQHLAGLEDEALVRHRPLRRGVGRPARVWELTDRAGARFPDSHADLTVELLEAMRSAFGEDGLDRLLAARSRRQARQYRERMPPPDAPPERRVAALAALRREEGYMAEWSREDDGAWLLLENHCPVCAAARVCQGLCRDELGLFRNVLGRDLRVERIDHLLAGARRCAYRITRRERAGRGRSARSRR